MTKAAKKRMVKTGISKVAALPRCRIPSRPRHCPQDQKMFLNVMKHPQSRWHKSTAMFGDCSRIARLALQYDRDFDRIAFS